MSEFNEIFFEGLANVPSDYDCKDGQLAASVNCIAEDAGLRPLPEPTVLFTLEEGEKLLIIHKVALQTNYILLKDGKLSWIVKGKETERKEIKGVPSFTSVGDVVPIGNTIAVSTNAGLVYFLWKDYNYKYLGSRPELPTIKFGLWGPSTRYSHFWGIDYHNLDEFALPNIFFSVTEIGQEPTKSDYADATTAIYGAVLAKMAETATKKGKFWQPFFVRYAYKLYDGSYVWHSAPVLMLPTTHTPMIDVPQNEMYKKGDKTYIKNAKLYNAVNTLVYSALNTANLSNWTDIIQSVDIFVSAPLWTFDQSKNLEYTIRGDIMTTYPSIFFQYCCYSSHLYDKRTNQLDTQTDYLEGDYYYYQNQTNKYGELVITPKDSDVSSISFYAFRIPTRDDFFKDLCDVHTFYKVSEINIEDLKDTTDMETPVPLLYKDLTNLVTFATLPDDYQSRHTITPDSLYAYNSRLNIGGASITPPPPFSIWDMLPFRTVTGSSTYRITITVLSQINGVKTYSRCTDVMPTMMLPRYIYYPDHSAYKMQIEFFSAHGESMQKIAIPLTGHSFLNGAYFFAGFTPNYDITYFSKDITVEDTAKLPKTVPVHNQMYTSDPANPFVFAASNVTTCGTGEIKRLVSATRALSQGQFGQFPLYAFTTEGIWALSVGDDGKLVARQPVSRDVCVNTAAITQLDNAVIYPTAKGIMMIGGSDTSSISTLIESEYPFKVQTLPQFAKLQKYIDDTFDTSTVQDFLKTITLKDFIADETCRMMYDYRHSHIYVFCEKYNQALVFSRKSEAWGSSTQDIAYPVNAYPDAIAVSTNNSVLDFSNTDDKKTWQFAVTRPLRIANAADLFKTIEIMYVRGKFEKGHVCCVLYGSRDLENWFVVGSSSNDRLRHFGGSGYKYFRVAIIGYLEANESITKMSFQYRLRYSGKLR